MIRLSWGRGCISEFPHCCNQVPEKVTEGKGKAGEEGEREGEEEGGKGGGKEGGRKGEGG